MVGDENSGEQVKVAADLLICSSLLQRPCSPASPIDFVASARSVASAQWHEISTSKKSHPRFHFLYFQCKVYTKPPRRLLFSPRTQWHTAALEIYHNAPKRLQPSFPTPNLFASYTTPSYLILFYNPILIQPIKLRQARLNLNFSACSLAFVSSAPITWERLEYVGTALRFETMQWSCI